MIRDPQYSEVAPEASEEMNGKSASIALSVIIAIRDSERAAPIRKLFEEYKLQLERIGHSYEFIFVIEGNHPEIVSELTQLNDEGERITVLVFAQWYGDATVLSTGFKHAAGKYILTLPAYHQVDSEVIPSLFSDLEGHDMVVVRRWPREDGAWTRLQVRAYHFMLRSLLGFDFHDLGCSVRLFRRKVIETVHIYGDQHRFLPVLASHFGFRVKEIEAPQTKQDTFQRHSSPGLYVNRLLDLLSIFFLAKFTRKPLRFFGSSGLVIFSAGLILTLYLVIQRLFMGIGLADKPILLLGILLLVLGTLFLAIGLIGEMIIFTNAEDLEEYSIDQIIN